MNPTLTITNADDRGEAPLVEQVVHAVGHGESMLLTQAAGPRSPTLMSISRRFAGTRTRILHLRPPLDLPAVLHGLADIADPGRPGAERDNAADLPFVALNTLSILDPACDRILLLIEDAHLMTRGTLQYLDTVLAATPHLHLVLAGQSELARVLAAPELAVLRRRLAIDGPVADRAAAGAATGRGAAMPQPSRADATRSAGPGRRRAGVTRGPLLVALGAAAFAVVLGLSMVAVDGAVPAAMLATIQPGRDGSAPVPRPPPAETASAIDPGALADTPLPAGGLQTQDMPSRLAALQRRVAERAVHLAALPRQVPARNDTSLGMQPDPLPAVPLNEPLPGLSGRQARPTTPPVRVAPGLALPDAVAARIVVNYLRGSPAAEQQAAELTRSLRAKGLDATGPEPLAARPGDPSVGYFFAEDAAAAAAIARDAGEAGHESLTMPQGDLPRPGTIRIMLRGNAPPIPGR